MPVMKPPKDRKNPASSDSKTNIRKVTPSIIHEEKPSPKTKLLSPSLNKTPNTPPTPVAAPAMRLIMLITNRFILAPDGLARNFHFSVNNSEK